MMKKSQLAVALLGATGFGVAQADDLSYSYLQGSYSQTEVDLDSENLDLDGVNLTGSFELGSMFFVTVDFGRTEGSDSFAGVDVDAEFDTRTLGVGLHTALNDKLDFVASIGRSEADSSVEIEGFGEVDDESDANLLSVGLRGMATDSLELFGNAIYVDSDDDSETQLSLGGLYHVNSAFGVGLGFTSADDADTTAVFARVSF